MILFLYHQAFLKILLIVEKEICIPCFLAICSYCWLVSPAHFHFFFQANTLFSASISFSSNFLCDLMCSCSFYRLLK